MTKVFIIDDHPLFRDGLRWVLSEAPEVQVIGGASTARAAFPLVDSAKRDVVFMDIVLPGMDGIAATREIRRRARKTRVLMLTMHDGIHYVREALDAGATG